MPRKIKELFNWISYKRLHRLSILIVLFAGSFLNIAFINKNEPEIKGLICGNDLYMNVLKNNFSLEDIYTGEPQNKIESEFDSSDIVMII